MSLKFGSISYISIRNGTSPIGFMAAMQLKEMVTAPPIADVTIVGEGRINPEIQMRLLPLDQVTQPDERFTKSG